MTKFTDWLENELSHRKMSPADLARAAKKDQGIISRILSGERNPQPETLLTIAHALKIPPDVIFRAAGLLPLKPSEDELADRAELLVRSFKTEQYRQIALATLETLLEQEEKGNLKPGSIPAGQEP